MAIRTDAPTAGSQMRYMLQKIDDQLGRIDLEALNYICLDFLGLAKLESTDGALRIFEELENQRKIGPTNTDLLKECLYRMGRYDLLRKMQTNKGNVEVMLKERSHLSRFRQVIFEVAQDLGDSEVNKLKYLVSGVPKPRLGAVENSYQFLMVLEQMEVISPGDTKVLQDALHNINRRDLSEKLAGLAEGAGTHMRHEELPSGNRSHLESRPTRRPPAQKPLLVTPAAAAAAVPPATNTFVCDKFIPSDSMSSMGSLFSNEGKQVEGAEGGCDEASGPSSVMVADDQLPDAEPPHDVKAAEKSKLGYAVATSPDEGPIPTSVTEGGSEEGETRPEEPSDAGEASGSLASQHSHESTSTIDIQQDGEQEQETAGVVTDRAEAVVESHTVTRPAAQAAKTKPAEGPVEAEADPLTPDDNAHVPTVVDALDNRYPLKKGLCLIINIRKYATHKDEPERKGSERDVESIKNTFGSLRFDVKVLEKNGDIEKQDLIDFLRKWGKEMKDHDCLVVFVMAHGEDGSIECSDGAKLPVDKMYGFFDPHECPQLKGKPKVFFVQACRGARKLPAYRDDIHADDAGSGLTLPPHADYLMSYATVRGYSSYRSERQGSWYIYKLTQTINRQHNKEDLLSILTIVNREVGKGKTYDEGREANAPVTEDTAIYCQQPEFVSRLTKKLYLC